MSLTLKMRKKAKTTATKGLTNHMAYQYQEGKGSAFPNDYKTTDAQPDYKGKAMWKGEIIEISLWEGETQAGVKKFSVSIQEPRQRSATPQRVVSSEKPAASSRKFTPRDDRDEGPLPF